MDIKFTKTIESWISAAKTGDTQNAQQLFQSTESTIQEIIKLKEKQLLSKDDQIMIEKLNLIASNLMSKLEEIQKKESLPKLIKNLNGNSKEKPATEIFSRLINSFPVKDPIKDKDLASCQQKLLEISQESKWEIKENKLIINPIEAKKLDSHAFWSAIKEKLSEEGWEKLEIEEMGEITRERLQDCIKYQVSLPAEKLFVWQKKMDTFGLWLKEGFTRAQLAAITGSLEHYSIKETEQETDPTSPIEFAVMLGHVHIVEKLLKEGAKLYFLTPVGVREFLSKDKEMLFLIARQGFDLNKIDQNGQTLLTQAIIDKDQEFVKILLQAGCNPRTLNKSGIAPLTLASVNTQFEIAKMIIQEGGTQFAVLSKEHPTPLDSLYYLKFNYPHDFKSINEILAQKEPILLKQLKEQYLIKMISHSTNQKGTLELKPIKEREASTLSIDKEGGIPFFWLNKMAKATKLMEKQDFDLLTQTLKFSSNIKAQTTTDTLLRIQEGLPVILYTGYVGHTVSVLIWGDYFVLCNRGESSRAPIEIYKYDKEKMTENIIESIQNTTKGDAKSYQDLFFNTLPKELNFKQGIIEKAIQKGCSLPDQKVGNCSWASPETAVWALRSLQNIFGEEKGKLKNTSPSTTEVVQALTNGKREFRSWLVSNQLYHIDRYIKRTPNDLAPHKERNLYPLDKKSIDMAFRNSRNIKDSDIDPTVAKKRKELFKYYDHTFLKPLGFFESLFIKTL